MFDPGTIGLLLALLSAVFWASLDITRKHIGGSMTASAAVIGLMFWQAPLIAPFLAGTEAGLSPAASNPLYEILFVGVPSLTLDYGLLAAVSVALNIVANLLFLRAVQISPLSLTTPYLAFTPVFSALAAYLTIGQEPTGWGIAGIGTVCLGAFFLNPGQTEAGILAPLKALWDERGSLYMVVVALLWSVTPVVDKEAAAMTSPMWHTLVLALGIGLGLVGWRLARDRRAAELLDELRSMRGWLIAGGFFLVGAMVLQLASYEFIKIAYVETLKRAVGVLGAILAGWILFEEKDIARGLGGALVMAAGVAMILMTDAGV